MTEMWQSPDHEPDQDHGRRREVSDPQRQDWTTRLGQRVQPFLQRLYQDLPDLRSAMVCTADGINLCTIGMGETQVPRVSALTSSLYSMSGAVTDAVHADSGETLDMVSLANGSSNTVVIAINGTDAGPMLLWATAMDTTIGALTVHARLTAKAIRADLLAGTADGLGRHAG